jgi:hypothetical protein
MKHYTGVGVTEILQVDDDIDRFNDQIELSYLSDTAAVN